MTSGAPLCVAGFGEALFRAGLWLESLATQTRRVLTAAWTRR